MKHLHYIRLSAASLLIAAISSFSSNAFGQTTKDIVLGTNNMSIQEVVLSYNGSTITQSSGASGVTTSTALPVNILEVTIETPGGEEVLDFFNSEGVTIRNNNFAANVQGVGVYSEGTSTSAANQSAWEAAMIDVVNNNNLLSYMYYDGSSNLPSGADFDVNWIKGLTSFDYLVVEERDGNTYFTLTPLGADGDPITSAKALRFGFTNGTNSGNGSAKYDWNTGFAPGNYTTQPMMLTVVDVEEFESNETIYGIRIDNNGDADVKFYGLSYQGFDDNPGNPIYTNDITGTVWLDSNDDETIDGGETERASNATVYLYDDANGNGVIDSGEETPIDEVLTNENGEYTFSPLYDSGTEYYIVATDNNFLDFVYEFTTDNIETASFSSTGNVDSNNDFGYNYNPNFVFVSGTVWNDEDEDEIIDGNEEGRSGSTIVYLYEDANSNQTLDPAEETPIATTTTDENGEYLFAQYYDGAIDYIVAIEEGSLTATYDLTTDNIEVASFSSGGTIDQNNDFGYAQDNSLVGISGTVWLDENSNGTNESSELITKSGITVFLYDDANNNGVLDPSEESAIDSVETNNNGYYKFDRTFIGGGGTNNVTAVEYSSGVLNPNNSIGDPSTTFTSFYNNGDNLILEMDQDITSASEYTIFLSNRNSGSDAQVIVSESTDGINFTYAHTIDVLSDSKAGYTVTAGQTTRYLKFDKSNINSISGYNVSGSASGNSNDYNIYGVEASGSTESYITKIDESDLGASCNLTTDNIETATFTQGGTIDENNDFGYNINPAKVLIAGTVWEDRDADQNIDGSEDGRADGVTVNLFDDANGNGILDQDESTPVATTTTNTQGEYEFTRDLNTSSSYATAVEYESGITNANSALGDAGTTYAEFYDGGDNLILELTNQVSSGDTYTIYLGNRTSGQNAEVIVSESSDGINFTYNTTITVTTDSKGQYEVIAGSNTKYIKFDKGSINTITGYNVTGSASGSNNDYNVFGAEVISGDDNYIITVDESTFAAPNTTNLTTDNIEVANFTASGSDLNNYFGYRNTQALPVTWLKFDVEEVFEYVELNWITGTETNNELFIIERSIDGINFEEIDRVYSAAPGGNSLDALDYEYVDYYSPAVTTVFYRIKQIDYDGTYDYSITRVLNSSAAIGLAEVQVYPNPATDFINVAAEFDGEVTLSNTNGVALKYGRTNQSIETADLTTGTYIIQVVNGAHRSQRIISVR